MGRCTFLFPFIYVNCLVVSEIVANFVNSVTNIRFRYAYENRNYCGNGQGAAAAAAGV